MATSLCSRVSTTTSWPLLQATWRGVHPWLLTALGCEGGSEGGGGEGSLRGIEQGREKLDKTGVPHTMYNVCTNDINVHIHVHVNMHICILYMGLVCLYTCTCTCMYK